MIDRYFEFVKANGYFAQKRREQDKYWMIETINDRLKSNFYNDPEIEDLLISKENLVLSNKLSSFIAAQDVLNRYFEKLRQGK